MDDEQQVSTAIRLWRYFRAKGRNARWVLKTKGVRGVWRNLGNEIMWLSGRYLSRKAAAEAEAGGGEAQAPRIPDSAFCDQRRLMPPSPRPTRCQRMPSPPLTIDGEAIGQALKGIKEELRHSSAIQGRLHHDNQ